MKNGDVRPSRPRLPCFSGIVLSSMFVCLSCGGDPDPAQAPGVVNTATPLEAACADGVDNDADGNGDCADLDCQSPGGECVSAPPLDRTVATSVPESAAYVYSGDNPLQKSADAKAFDAKRLALLRGRTVDVRAKPLSGVKVSVKEHPEYGFTYSRGDGAFDFAVNGGERLVFEYSLAGHLPLQRSLKPGWQRYEILPDAGLTALAAKESRLEADSPQTQLILGEHVADEFADRTPLVVMDPNTTASAVLSDGDTLPLSHLTVTATEYPIRPERTFSPGSVSTQGGLVYGLDFAVKEADELSAEHVVFSQPLSLYVEELAGMPVGHELTVQHYNRTLGQWEAGARGKVVQVVNRSDAEVSIDMDGDGAADAEESLEQQGISANDRQELAKWSKVGQKLWHAELSHFSSLQVEAKGTPPAGAAAPVRRGIVTKPLDRPTYAAGMVIEKQASLHTEPITGTPYSLRYQSDRSVSYGAGRMLEIPLVGPTVPAGLKRVRCRVSVTNRVYEQEYDAVPNARCEVLWDGSDANGRIVQGQQVARITIGYVYSDRNNPQRDAVLPIHFDAPLGVWDARAFGLGSMSLNVHHAYDPYQQITYYGHGAQRSGANISLVAKPASLDDEFPLGTPDSLVVTGNGTLIVTDDQQGT